MTRRWKSNYGIQRDKNSTYRLFYSCDHEKNDCCFRFHSLAPIYYRGAPAGLVIYDVTYSESFRRAKLWVKELREANGREMVIGLAGNKLDLTTEGRRQIDVQEASEYAEEHGLIFMETSAKRGDNVAEVFLTIAKRVAEQHQPMMTTTPQIVLPPNTTTPKETRSCCMSKT